MALNNWMGRLKDDLKLNRVVLPATHDSGMSYQSYAGAVQNALNPLAIVTKGVSAVVATVDDLRPGTHREHYKAFHDNFTTQVSNVAGQLESGARQFDLRITRHNGTHRAYHGGYLGKIVGARRYGEKWADICAGIAKFMLARGGTEFLILKMDKQEARTFGWTKSTMQHLVDALNAVGCPTRQPDMLKNTWVDQAPIRDLRGRILVCGMPETLAVWRPMVAGTPIQLCIWKKNETGEHPKGTELPDTRISPNVATAFPTYVLLGGAKPKGVKGHSDRDNVLDKQGAMKTKFASIRRGTNAGMRGIWFNTFSWFRDIATYSEEIWKPENRDRRDGLWLEGLNRQNVASVDFITDQIGQYVVDKNLPENWKELDLARWKAAGEGTQVSWPAFERSVSTGADPPIARPPCSSTDSASACF